jgi:hypothetical protein
VKKKFGWPLLLVLVFALSRWPGLLPANFSATYALVFCAGIYMPGVAGWIIPLVVMAVSDFVLSLFFYPGFTWSGFLLNQAPNYLAYAGLIAFGRSLRGKRPWWLLLGGGIIGAMLFYLVTNTFSWLTMPGYAKTFADWIRALTVGQPGFPQTWEFFRNTLFSGGLFTGLFFGAMKVAEAMEEKEKEEEEEETEKETEPSEAEPKPAEAKS